MDRRHFAPMFMAVLCGLGLALPADAEPIVLTPSLGGSLPLYVFSEILGTPPIVVVPIANHDNNQHAPNENLRIKNLWLGIEIYAALMARL